MSSTGRKRDRLGGPADFYRTPAWVVDRLLDAYEPPGRVWVGPCAGDGAIVRAVAKYCRASPLVKHHVVPRWILIELREAERVVLEDMVLDLELDASVSITDYLTLGSVVGSDDVTWVVDNPPFSKAQAFVERSRAMFPNADVTLLLRLNFLASDERAAFMRANPPDVFVLPDRPGFTDDGGGDSCEYAWMTWHPWSHGAGRIEVVGSTALSVRRPNKGI